jgi:phenylacetate-CoA ligase
VKTVSLLTARRLSPHARRKSSPHKQTVQGHNVAATASAQLERLNHLITTVGRNNPFYADKWRRAGLLPRTLHCLSELTNFPFTTRAELVHDALEYPPLGHNLTWPASAYQRLNRSSGTTNAPIYWADDAQSWQWVVQCSRDLFALAGLKRSDRIFFIAPLGASSGPWIMYEGAKSLGCTYAISGTLDVRTKLLWLKTFKPTVLIGKPEQLFALGAAAVEMNIDRARSGIRKIICAGRPGGGIPDTRRMIESAWDAPCFDRYGLTEAGSVAGECEAHPGGLHLLDSEFIAEVTDAMSGLPVADGEQGELVLTNLGRIGRPIIRYRTGDRVRLLHNYECRCGRTGCLLTGGIERTVESRVRHANCR